MVGDGAPMRALLLGTMAVWGLNLSVVKALTAVHHPLWVALLRMGVAAVTLLAIAAWHRGADRPALSPRQMLGLVVCALLMVYLNQIVFTEGVARTSATHAALIIALNPLVSSLGAALLLRERPRPARLLGIALGFGGVAAVVLTRAGAGGHGSGVGDALVLASVLSWVGGGMLVQRLARGLDAATISAAVHGVGALLLAAHLALWPPAAGFDVGALTGQQVLLLLLSGLFATALGALVWNRALATLGVARTALFVYWVPIFGVGFAVAWLGEPLTVWHVIGLAAVLGGTWLGTRSAS